MGRLIDTRLLYESGYNKGFKDGIKGSIPKDQYEARLKVDMIAMLTEMQMEIEECVDGTEGSAQFEQGVTNARVQVVEIIQQKIDKLKGVEE